MTAVTHIMTALFAMGGSPYMVMVVAEEVVRGRMVKFELRDGEIRYVQ